MMKDERDKRLRGESNNYILLLATFTERYLNQEEYRNDIRYLKLWCMRADIEETPEKSDEIFRILKSRRIGQHFALLYECWALKLESQGRIAEALQQRNLPIG
ncbi:MAG: hypothetical protein EZS28_009292 [Streblomastix strix]|uniref:BUB1 N-terminal domain-containing protein n=1 Tax=Streblomastix strix TaxID=222440 RepID=A0A5J4WJW0_9EUKA|nr:MAG: hypothetical protein EZS28_009292 [Streblomastix strix]